MSCAPFCRNKSIRKGNISVANALGTGHSFKLGGVRPSISGLVLVYIEHYARLNGNSRFQRLVPLADNSLLVSFKRKRLRGFRHRSFRVFCIGEHANFGYGLIWSDSSSPVDSCIGGKYKNAMATC